MGREKSQENYHVYDVASNENFFLLFEKNLEGFNMEAMRT